MTGISGNAVTGGRDLILFAEYNSPYLFAISFVLLIGLLEIISLIFGHFLSGALDAHLDHYDSLTSGNIGQALHYLNIGRIPSLIVLCLLAGFFGLFGILIQHGWVTLWQTPFSNLLLAPICLLLSVFAVHYSGKVIAPWLPRDETTALAEDEFIGNMAIITGHCAVAGMPCEGKFTDKFGQTHYLLLEPEPGKEFRKGDKVLIICRLSATRYLAELNPWPNVL
jgi:membrane protein implicated in regulation of membrane protease activity